MIDKIDKTLYSIINKRRTITAFVNQNVSEQIKEDVNIFIKKKIILLFPHSKIELFMVPGIDGTVNILGFSDNSIEGNLNLGMALQQLDLFLNKKELGSYRFAFEKNKTAEIVELSPSLHYLATLTFGHKRFPLQINTQDLKKAVYIPIRKPIHEVSNNINLAENKDLKSVLENMRLTPSMANHQPWFFELTMRNSKVYNRINIYIEKKSLLHKWLYETLHKIDIGGLILHGLLSLQKFGYNTSFVLDFKSLKGKYDKVGYISFSK